MVTWQKSYLNLRRLFFVLLNIIVILVFLITIFTWLNATATVTHIVKLDAATIQGQLIFEGVVYYTEASSLQLLLNNYNSIELKNR